MAASLYHWFSKSGNKLYLSDQARENSPTKQVGVAKVNERVVAAMEPTYRKQRYNSYSPELSAKIGKYAAKSGNKAAVEKFSAELRKPICESTVRGIKKHTTVR